MAFLIDLSVFVALSYLWNVWFNFIPLIKFIDPRSVLTPRTTPSHHRVIIRMGFSGLNHRVNTTLMYLNEPLYPRYLHLIDSQNPISTKRLDKKWQIWNFLLGDFPNWLLCNDKVYGVLHRRGPWGGHPTPWSWKKVPTNLAVIVFELWTLKRLVSMLGHSTPIAPPGGRNVPLL